MADEDINLEELAGLLENEVGASGAGSHADEVSGAVATAPGDEGGRTKRKKGDESEKSRRKRAKKEKRRSRRGAGDGSEAKKQKKKRGGDDGSATANEDDDSASDDSFVRSKFVLDAAESGSDEDADESDDDLLADSEELDDDNHGTLPQYAPDPTDDPFGRADLSNEEIARQIEERHRASKLRKRGGPVDPLTASQSLPPGLANSTRYISYMLPQSTDPKVFAVKCRPRMSRLLVARLVNKCYAYRMGLNFEKRRVDLGIISVFALDHVKEYIYIEAHRRLFVENALQGIEGLFRYNITLVQPTELMKMLEQRPTRSELRVGAFVRLRQKPYRADLAQIVSIGVGGQHVTCKVVPREDFVGKTFNKSDTRLPPKFFVPRQAVGVHELPGDGGYRWGDLTFDRDGYLLKQVSVRMVISGEQMDKLTFAELAIFFKNEAAQIRRAAAMEASATESQTEFRMGEVLCVASGQVRGAVGTVVDIVNRKIAVLLCTVPGRKEPMKIRVELANCRRHFVVGTHVLVESGVYAGESGTVVHTSGDVIRIFSDRKAHREFEVSTNECRQSKLTGSSGHSLGSLRLFDLVVLADSSGVACITRCNRADVDVLTDKNEPRCVTPAMIKEALQASGRQTTDALRNPIIRGSEVVVKANTGAPQHLYGKTGRVEQLFSKTIFVRFDCVKENSGVVAVDASAVQALGAKTTTRQVRPPRHLPLPERKPHHASRADLALFGLPGATGRATGSEDWAGQSEWYDLGTPSGAP